MRREASIPVKETVKTGKTFTAATEQARVVHLSMRQVTVQAQLVPMQHLNLANEVSLIELALLSLCFRHMLPLRHIPTTLSRGWLHGSLVGHASACRREQGNMKQS